MALTFYFGGVLERLIHSKVEINPFICIRQGITTIQGLKCSVCAFLVILLIAAVIVWRGRGKEVLETDEDRNFDYSVKGTYGTAGYMKREEEKEILNIDKKLDDVKGILFGKELDTGEYISLPVDSRLNRNLAVCGSQGSMKSRAFARNMALQCVRRGESMFISDPKSELYEDLAAYFKEQGYTVKQFNLIDLSHSNAWDCLAEIDDGSMIDVFVDVVIRNTTDKFDHFYDNVEMDLLKALCLYVYEEYPEGKKTFPEAYKLLLNKSVEMLDSIFERLPTNHPARGPYQLFSKAEKVKGNAVLGLGTRLQIMQNKLVQQITSNKDIDLTLPGKQKCAYFCIVSDQDNTFEFISSLFFSFLFIKLIRYADNYCEGGCLTTKVKFILDEFPNCVLINDFTKKCSTIRSRGCSFAAFFQNVGQMRNRYPDDQWQEIIGACDTTIFLGCTDTLTAEYFSDRIGEATVEVEGTMRELNTMHITNYTPSFRRTNSIGRRQLMTPDEVMRLPPDEELVFVRGQKVFRAHRFDYSLHPAYKKLKSRKAILHEPDWKKASRVSPFEQEHDADSITPQADAPASAVDLKTKPTSSIPAKPNIGKKVDLKDTI